MTALTFSILKLQSKAWASLFREPRQLLCIKLKGKKKPKTNRGTLLEKAEVQINCTVQEDGHERWWTVLLPVFPEWAVDPAQTWEWIKRLLEREKERKKERHYTVITCYRHADNSILVPRSTTSIWVLIQQDQQDFFRAKNKYGVEEVRLPHDWQALEQIKERRD